MSIEIGPQGDLARVRWLSPDRRRLHLDYRNGQTANVDATEPFTFEVGAVLLVRAEDDAIEVVDEDVWPEQAEVGVVRLKKDDVTVVDLSGRLRLLNTNKDIEYQEGNTVETKESKGIIRVLSEEPIRLIELPSVDDASISSFKTKPDQTAATFEDFGGLEKVVERARELIEIPLEHHDQLTAIGARPVQGSAVHRPARDGKNNAGADNRRSCERSVL